MQCLAVLFLAAALATADNLDSIRNEFQRHDPSIVWVQILARKPIDEMRAVIFAHAAKSAADQHRLAGVFIVSSQDNRILNVLDRMPASDAPGMPSIETLGAGSVYLHYYSDYGMYAGSVKYLLDPVVKVPYKIVGFICAAAVPRGVHFDGERASLNLTVSGPSLGGPRPCPAQQNPATGDAVVENTTPPGQRTPPSGIRVKGQFFPVPVPSMAQYHRFLPAKQKPLELENTIGPYVRRDGAIWFANTFYDGEGLSGIGAIASFDIATQRYSMRYLPEIAPWSASAIFADDGDLWIGLMRRPEGANFGGGLLRYNIATGAVTAFPVTDLIQAIMRSGDTIYCATTHGVYALKDDGITQWRVEPDRAGKLTIVTRTLPAPLSDRK